jgi:hypothetical protein
MATRLFVFKSTAKPSGFPYLTGREQVNMLLYQPRFRHPEKAAKPPNLADAEGIEPGLNLIFADPADLAVDMEIPSGEVLSVDDPTLIRRLLTGRFTDCSHRGTSASVISNVLWGLVMPQGPRPAGHGAVKCCRDSSRLFFSF